MIKRSFDRLNWFDQGLSEDCTDDSNMEFVNAYQRFRQIVNDGDERIANILRCYLQPCHQEIQKIHLGPIFRVILCWIRRERSLYLELVISNIWIDFTTKTIERFDRSIHYYSYECHWTWTKWRWDLIWSVCQSSSILMLIDKSEIHFGSSMDGSITSTDSTRNGTVEKHRFEVNDRLVDLFDEKDEV